jgi:cell division protein
MERLFENLALKIEGEIKNYVSKHRLNKMLEEVKTDEVSEKTLKEALVFDTSKKTQEEQNVNKILVGLMVDSFINKNGQEAFDSLLDELEEEQKAVEVIKPQVVEVIEPEVVVEEDVVPVAEPTERKSIKLTSSKKATEQATEQVTEPVIEEKPVVEAVEPVAEPVVEESPLAPTPEPVPLTPTPEPIKPVVVVEPAVEQVYPTPTPEPIRPVVVEEPVGSYTEQQVPEWQMPQQAPQQQMVRPSDFSPKFDDAPTTFEASFEEESLDEVETEKKGGVLKYLAVGIPTLLLVGGMAFWQLNNQKQVNIKAESQATEILKGMPKEAKKGDGLSNSEYEDNIEALTKGIDTIKQDDNTGLSGYLVYDDKKYIIKKYEQASGSLIVFNEEGEEITFDNEWVEKLVKKAKKNKQTEASPVEEKQEENPAEQQEKKQEENPEGKPEEKPAEQQEGGSV